MIWRASVVLVWSMYKEYYPIIVGKVILFFLIITRLLYKNYFYL